MQRLAVTLEESDFVHSAQCESYLAIACYCLSSRMAAAIQWLLSHFSYGLSHPSSALLAPC